MDFKKVIKRIDFNNVEIGKIIHEKLSNPVICWDLIKAKIDLDSFILDLNFVSKNLMEYNNIYNKFGNYDYDNPDLIRILNANNINELLDRTYNYKLQSVDYEIVINDVSFVMRDFIDSYNKWASDPTSYVNEITTLYNKLELTFNKALIKFNSVFAHYTILLSFISHCLAVLIKDSSINYVLKAFVYLNSIKTKEFSLNSFVINIKKTNSYFINKYANPDWKNIKQILDPNKVVTSVVRGRTVTILKFRWYSLFSGNIYLGFTNDKVYWYCTYFNWIKVECGGTIYDSTGLWDCDLSNLVPGSKKDVALILSYFNYNCTIFKTGEAISSDLKRSYNLIEEIYEDFIQSNKKMDTKTILIDASSDWHYSEAVATFQCNERLNDKEIITIEKEESEGWYYIGGNDLGINTKYNVNTDKYMSDGSKELNFSD